MRYDKGSNSLVVGVMDESNFSADDWCCDIAHCFHNYGDQILGCLSGTQTQWNPGELLEIHVNLIDYTLTIKSFGKCSINLSGTLPRLRNGNYPFASLFWDCHILEIVE
ncbi:hypothetical protein GEMRC1_014106 [Eukaryota sp. GEM-RC1]